MTQKISTRPNKNRKNESGNVFLFILIGIVLFAALSFTMSRGFRTEGTSKLSKRQAELAASEIMTYIQRIERGITRVRNNNISENDISLEFGGSFVNTACDASGDPEFPGCQVFNAQGGRVAEQAPPDNANDGTSWHFTGDTCIADIGSGATGCDSDGLSNEELLVVLRDMDQDACEALNKKLNISGIPTDSGSDYSANAFTGSFSDDSELIIAGGPFKSACYDAGGGTYNFYSVLIER